MFKEKIKRKYSLRICILFVVLLISVEICVQYKPYWSLKRLKYINQIVDWSRKVSSNTLVDAEINVGLQKQNTVHRQQDPVRMGSRGDPWLHPTPGIGVIVPPTSASSVTSQQHLQGRRERQQEPRRHKKALRWHIDLQPWASSDHSFEQEALRFLDYITTPQIGCENKNHRGLLATSEASLKSWAICLDDRFSLTHRIKARQCRVYSLGLGSDDSGFEGSLVEKGCEIHHFDPSIKQSHIQERKNLWHHRLSVDWRDPNPAIAARDLQGNRKKLGTIMREFGHRKIDILKADVESAEWKIMENMILENVIENIGQLIIEVHLHWPGFEVSGDDSSVVRYWYSLLRELEMKEFRLFCTYKDLTKPQIFLQKHIFNASSSYTLSWVNTRWKH
ncbi:methyltransferase-like protein 24 [Protopterus annectens]|uniref:methyltransferase-like protein 24 n=1 Tax=Protopterus annectens TaxID=7888 RepID=UPI001CFB7984|nr:methyltransferase-like protein 24 [Protopterus annectens]